MKEVDYIIVGCGLAGIAFTEILFQNKKSFVVFDNSSQQSSVVAAGLYNPVILKRFSPVWKAKEQLQIALPNYENIEKRLQIKIDYQLKLLRRFASIEEQNLWFTALDRPSLNHYLSPEIIKNKNEYIDAPFGFGQVNQVGRLDTELLIKAYKKWLSTNNNLQNETFDYSEINIQKDFIKYKNFKAKHIIFAEGFGLKKNPFFNSLPLNGTKGETIIIDAPNLKIDYGIKSSVFLIPIENDLYKVGATYEWEDKTNNPTDKGKSKLIKKLKTFLKCDFKIIDQKAGIRPTVIDRRPLVGKHEEFKSLYVLNGLGTRGLMIGPYVAKQLYYFIENNIELNDEIDIKRFNK